MGSGTGGVFFAVAFAMLAPWPAAGTPLALFQLLPGAADPPLTSRLLLGVFHPTDEFVAGQRCDVVPSVESDVTRDQRRTQVAWKLVDDSTGHLFVAHVITLEHTREHVAQLSGHPPDIESVSPKPVRL